MEVTELGIVNEPVKFTQFENALFPMLVTELGIVNVPIKPHPINAQSPIEVTELGISKEPLKLSHQLKADCPIAITTYSFPLYFTLSGITRLPVQFL